MLKYDDFDFSPYLIVNYVGKPLLPPQTLFTKSIGGRPGAYFFEKKDEPIIIPVGITLSEDTLTNYFERKRFLSGHFNKERPKKIVFGNEPHMYIEGILEGSTDLDEIASFGQGVLNFFCPDPFYYAIDDEFFAFKDAGKYSFRRDKGNTKSLPLVEIKGTNSNGVITLKASNTTINFDGTLKTGETLVFDSDLITSYILKENGEKESANDDIDTMTFPFLKMGLNEFEISIKDGATIQEVRIQARSRWT